MLDVRGGLNYYHNVTSTEGNGLTTSTEVGIPGANLDEYTSGISQISIGGHSDPVLGFSASQPWDRSEKTWNVATTLTKLLSTHTVKIGGEWRNNLDMLLQTQDAGGPRGRFTFNASGTGVPSETNTLSGPANAFASFLLDWPNGVQRDLKVIDEPGTKHWATFLFIHDKWQARSNVTVDLGLRWEYYNPLEGIEGARQPGELRPGHQHHPRLGLRRYRQRPEREEDLQELRAADRRVVASQRQDGPPRRLWRGHDSVPGQPVCVQLPGEAELLRVGRQRLPASGLDGGRLPGAGAARRSPSNGIVPVSGSLLNSTFDVIPPDLREGTLHSWNVAFQRQLPFSLTADIAYVGNRGVDLVMDVDTNASLVYGCGNNGRPQFAQFNRTGNSRTRTNDNKSQYNALQMKVDRRFRNGLMITNSYTLSRSKDYVNENTTIGTPIDFELSWARSNFDRLHNYVLTTIYELPVGPGREWLSDGLAGKIIGGWQVSGVYNLQSGTPLTIGGNGTLLNTPGNSAFANLNGEHRVLGGLGPGLLYFDPAVYSLPRGGHAGQSERATAARTVRGTGTSTCRSSSGSAWAGPASPRCASTPTT